MCNGRYSLYVIWFILLIITTITSSSADYSAPSGIIKLEIQPGEEILASTPFDAFDSSLNRLFDGQLSGATIPGNADQVRIWDSSVQGFKSAFLGDNTGDKNKDGKWFKDNVEWEPTDITLFPGIGFFIKNNQLTVQSLFLSGRIPLDDARILTLQPNLNLFSYPFPARISLNNTNLKNQGAKGGLNQSDSPDIVSTEYPSSDYWLMDNSLDSYDGKWHDSENSVSRLAFKPGAGYWYERLGLNPFQWSEKRPYQNLFNINATAPCIVDMVFNAEHDEVMLDIECTGEFGEALEIFFKDLSMDDSFATENEWSLADQNIASSGNTQILWTDAGRVDAQFPFVNRCKINNAFMRIYIVSRQDIDSDNDNISNGRERFVYGTNPENTDTDGDGLSDGMEINTCHTNPNSTDSDVDGYSDFHEIITCHTDPNNAASNPAVMPSGWNDIDIGATGTTGSASYFNGVFTVKGAGSMSASSKLDNFNYCYCTKILDVNCEIKARVVSQQSQNSLAKAGIMIRKNTGDSTRYVYAYFTSGRNASFLKRVKENINSALNIAGGAAMNPYWLKLVKSGNKYTPYKSSDGSTWGQIGTASHAVDMGDNVLAGFAVNSHDKTKLSSVEFDNFSISLTDAPTITPGGYFQMNQSAALISPVADSQIWYTSDGNDPDANDPNSNSTLYTHPFNVTASCNIKARIFKTGYNPGPVASAIFNQPGLMVKYFSGNWTTLPDFSAMTPYKVSMIPNIDYPDNFGSIMTSGLCDNVAAVITGQITCPVKGSYKFYLSSGEGAALYIDGRRLIYSPNIRKFAQSASPSISLEAGLHDIKVEYFEVTGSGGLQLKWSYPGQITAIIQKGSFFSQDSDADGLPDQWEIYRFGNLNHAGTEDTDGDGFSDKDELNLFFTDPSDISSKPSDNTNPTDILSGISVIYCAKNKRTWTSVPDFDLLPHYGSTAVKQIYYPATTAKFATSGTATKVAAQFIGFIEIPKDGFYKFYLNCDDGANLYVDDMKIVDNGGLHKMRESYGFASLKSGKHRIRLDYCQMDSYNGLILSYEGYALSKQIVPAAALFHSPQYLLDMINTDDPDSDGVNTITASAGENGAIAPSGAVKLEYGTSQFFAITPEEKHRVSDVLVDGVSVGAVTSYQFTNVKSPHTITANFAINTHAVTFDLAGKGIRTGGGELSQPVSHGSGATAPAVTANAAWIFTGWDKTFDNITTDTTVTAQYSKISCTLNFAVGANGTIKGIMVQAVNYGDSCEEVTAVPDIGYHFVIWNDGVETASRTENNVTGNKTVTASFAINSFTTTASAGLNGSITPSGMVTVNHGTNQSFTFAPNVNYHISDVIVDGVSVGAVTSYQFTNVTGNHTISANFAIYTHNVTFNLAGKGTRAGGGALSQTVNHGSGAPAPTITASAGWTFTGWDKTFDNITTDTNVTAQ